MHFHQLVFPIPYLADEISREPVARLKQSFGTYYGSVNPNHNMRRIWRPPALRLIHSQ